MQPKKVIIQSEYSEEHQLVVEQSVLGQILINSEAIYEVAKEFHVKLFSDERNVLIASAILKLHLSNKAIDFLTLVEQLKKNGQLEQVDGIVYISSLTKNIGTTSNLEQHIRLLQQYWLARFVNQSCNEAQLNLLEYKKDVFDVYSELQVKLDSALKDLVKKDIAILSDVSIHNIERFYDSLNGSGSSGVPTGLIRLDNLTNGFQSSDLIILAGRTSMGKTAFSLSILIDPVVNQKIPVAFFSLEMSKEQVVGRIQSIVSKIDVSKIVKKQLSFEEINLLVNRCQVLENAPLYIDDTPNISLLELKTKSRKLVRENGVKMIVVDYLQLMRSGMKTSSREQEIAEISKGLKAIAKELNIPVIALSQLSRSVEQRGGDKKPMLSDLRESGQIEQDADMVLFCFRPEYYGLTDYNWFGDILDTKKLFMLIIAKHRNGVLGEIPLAFYGEYTQITNHSDTNRLYETTYSSSNSGGNNTPNQPIVTGNKAPETNSIAGNILPNSNDSENNTTGKIIPNNGIMNNIRFPYLDNNDLENFLDETPF
jgi:replicative DNA helicase